VTAIFNWIEKHLLACPFKKYLHIECPGCGLQRSVLALFRGNLVDSWQLYPATIPIIALLTFLALHLRYKFAFGATVIKYLYFSIAFIVLVFYIYKIINHKITT
jgi:hypothetical protein